MYRQIFTPSEQNSRIPITIPHEWYGRLVEVIVFPVSAPSETQTDNEDFYSLFGAWESEQSAEEMVADLKTSRKFREKNLTF
ncbi:hypothetical protein FACS189446_1200 [Bacteroidia bacterium]|nr:hypothetical protein FACS189446_1200 [Bacteroidia bacterium]